MYVFLHVDCYIFSVVCLVVLDWEAVLVCAVAEVLACERNDGWCVWVSLYLLF